MKKIFILMLSFIIFCSCTNCSKRDVETLTVKQELNVENIISTDREAMYLMKDSNYRWFETGILFENYLDEENDGEIEEIVNVFQFVKEEGQSFDTKVFKFQHFADGTIIKDSINGFWTEDFPLNEEVIKVPFDSAFALIQRVNLPKPHSRHCTLRKPIGPKPCNAQWIFGNVHEQIWVDATTGTIRNSNPAFPDGFKMPLGEWP